MTKCKGEYDAETEFEATKKVWCMCEGKGRLRAATCERPIGNGMQRHELLNSIIALERELGRNPYHIAGSRKKHLGAFSLAEASDEALVAFLAHLENESWMASVGCMGKKQLELI